MRIAAVVFDLDGVIVESEQVWDAVREDLTREAGGRWGPHAHPAMMGMSTPEWTAYMHEELGVPLAPGEIAAEVTRRLADRYAAELPLLPGAVTAVRRLADRWPLAVASSSFREIIELVLDRAGVRAHFAAVASSEEVPRGKPAPDVYIEAARRLGVPAGDCCAVEDSGSGIRAAAAAGMAVVAIPNDAYPPGPDAMAHAHVALTSIGGLTPDVVERAAGLRAGDGGA